MWTWSRQHFRQWTVVAAAGAADAETVACTDFDFVAAVASQITVAIAVAHWH